MHLIDTPLLFFAVLLLAFWISARAGYLARKWRGETSESEREELQLVVTGTLTLLALIIGFSFSMAVGRYDERKRDEAVEANTIGTEYHRLGMLQRVDGTNARTLLKQYLNQRILWYETHDESGLAGIDSSTGSLQQKMWSIVENAGRSRGTAISSLVASGMNEVIDSQGYTLAAWLNRIPYTAWALMILISLSCTALIGYGSRPAGGAVRAYGFLPVVLAISLFLIADLDSTRRGLINNVPENLTALAQSLNAH